MSRKQTITEEEEKEVDRSIIQHIPDGETVLVTDFFSRLDDDVPPVNEYDVVLYHIIDRPRYYIGSAAARARDGLKPGGIFIVDYHGAASDLNEIRVITEFVGLKFKEHDKKNSVMIFTKPLVNETVEIKLEDEE